VADGAQRKYGGSRSGCQKIWQAQLTALTVNPCNGYKYCDMICNKFYEKGGKKGHR
jgi:hypothetical protein